MTKHKPATSLPWYDCRLNWVQPNFDEANAPQNNLQADSGFARYACNAYPRLVEALRDIMAVYGDSESADEFANKFNAEKFRALLRELGEIE